MFVRNCGLFIFLWRLIWAQPLIQALLQFHNLDVYMYHVCSVYIPYMYHLHQQADTSDIDLKVKNKTFIPVWHKFETIDVIVDANADVGNVDTTKRQHWEWVGWLLVAVVV